MDYKKVMTQLKNFDSTVQETRQDSITFNEQYDRYKDTMPYNSSSVQLLPHCTYLKMFPNLKIDYKDEDDDVMLHDTYVNASYIQPIEKQRTYIAASAPTFYGRDNFWRMLWEKDVGVVVMLTKEMEIDKPKADRYWNLKIGQELTKSEGCFKVKFTKEENLLEGSVVVRTHEMRSLADDTKKTVVLIQYLKWPDKGVPKNFEEFLELNKQYRSYRKKKRTDVIHCSAGVGRTGTFILLDAILDELASPSQMTNIIKKINIIKSIVRMRESRPLMVQTPEQLQFIHEWLAWYLKENKKDVSFIEYKIEDHKLNNEHEDLPLITYYPNSDVRHVRNHLCVKGTEKDQKKKQEVWAPLHKGSNEYYLISIVDGMVRVRPLLKYLNEIQKKKDVTRVEWEESTKPASKKEDSTNTKPASKKEDSTNTKPVSKKEDSTNTKHVSKKEDSTSINPTTKKRYVVQEQTQPINTAHVSKADTYYRIDGIRTKVMTKAEVDAEYYMDMANLQSEDITQIMCDLQLAHTHQSAYQQTQQKARDITSIGNYCMYLNNELRDINKNQKLKWVVGFYRITEYKNSIRRAFDRLRFFKNKQPHLNGYYCCEDTHLLVPDINTYLRARGKYDTILHNRLPPNIPRRYLWYEPEGCDNIKTGVSMEKIMGTLINGCKLDVYSPFYVKSKTTIKQLDRDQQVSYKKELIDEVTYIQSKIEECKGIPSQDLQKACLTENTTMLLLLDQELKNTQSKIRDLQRNIDVDMLQ